MVHIRGVGKKSSQKTSREKHPVSHRVFLMDDVVVMKTMHGKFNYRGVSVFVISNTSQ